MDSFSLLKTRQQEDLFDFRAPTSYLAPTMLGQVLNDAVTLWVVIDPIGTLPVFLAVTRAMEPAMRRKTALRAVLISAVILVAFIVGGQFLLSAMKIKMGSFQIAGGIVLFLFALSMIFEKPVAAPAEGDDSARDVAVFPLAVPSIASPAAMMAVVVLTDNDRFSYGEQASTAVVMVAILSILYLLLLMAEPIKRAIGQAGADIIGRVMGLVLAALAVETVVDGFKLLGHLG